MAKGGSPKSSSRGFTGQGDTGGLTVLVVATQKEWPMGEVQNTLAAASPARGRRIASLCPWSLLRREGWPMGEVQSPLAASSLVSGRRVR